MDTEHYATARLEKGQVAFLNRLKDSRGLHSVSEAFRSLLEGNPNV